MVEPMHIAQKTDSEKQSEGLRFREIPIIMFFVLLPKSRHQFTLRRIL